MAAQDGEPLACDGQVFVVAASCHFDGSAIGSGVHGLLDGVEWVRGGSILVAGGIVVVHARGQGPCSVPGVGRTEAARAVCVLRFDPIVTGRVVGGRGVVVARPAHRGGNAGGRGRVVARVPPHFIARRPRRGVPQHADLVGVRPIRSGDPGWGGRRQGRRRAAVADEDVARRTVVVPWNQVAGVGLERHKAPVGADGRADPGSLGAAVALGSVRGHAHPLRLHGARLVEDPIPVGVTVADEDIRSVVRVPWDQAGRLRPERHKPPAGAH